MQEIIQNNEKMILSYFKAQKTRHKNKLQRCIQIRNVCATVSLTYKRCPEGSAASLSFENN